jgi:trehalose-6-phosphatase
MNIEEVGKLLAKVALIENKTATNEQIIAWAELLQGVEYEHANEALVRHYQHKTDSLKPAHIYKGAKEISQEEKKIVYERKQITE